MIRSAYRPINWGETPDLAATFAEIREAGWRAVELFWHALDWLAPPAPPLASVGGQRRAGRYGVAGGNRRRWRPPRDEEYAELARFCEELAIYGAERGIAVAYHPHVG